MVNKEAYKSAMDKINASEEFKIKTKELMTSPVRRKDSLKIKVLIPSFAALLLVTLIGIKIVFLPHQNGGTFRITGRVSSGSACYASILYLDGYEYSPSSWLNYSRYTRYGVNGYTYDSIKGEKLGEVTLDLKGITYEGTPPNFSSTHDIGSEIYAIKNVKKEHAVLLVSKGFTAIFYRLSKLVKDDKTPIDLTMSEVFHMITDSPKVSGVELRDHNNGSWMRTSTDEHLLSLINKELPEQQILRPFELDQNPYESSQNPYEITSPKIPVNLVFSDGSALPLVIFPEINIASVFRGFIKLSPDLMDAFKELSLQGEEYPSISALLPYSENDISYLYIENHRDGLNILCREPKWSASALFDILKYYRVKEVKPDEKESLVMTFTLGRSKEDSITLDFYETKDKYIIIKFKEHYYKPAKGQMVLEELIEYINSYTGYNS